MAGGETGVRQSILPAGNFPEHVRFEVVEDLVQGISRRWRACSCEFNSPETSTIGETRSLRKYSRSQWARKRASGKVRKALGTV